MADISLLALLENYFGPSFPLIRVTGVEVELKSGAWFITMVAPEPVVIDEQDLKDHIIEAYPFLKDVVIHRKYPETLQEVCGPETLGMLVHAQVGGSAADYAWKYEGNGISIESDGDESNSFITNLQNQVQVLTGFEAEITRRPRPRPAGELLFGRAIKAKDNVQIVDLNGESGRVVLEGEIFTVDYRTTKAVATDRKTGKEIPKSILTFNITDTTSSVSVKRFDNDDICKELFGVLKEGDRVRMRGDCQIDKFRGELVVDLKDLEKLPKKYRKDNAKEKRVELHLHTTMSSMDGFCPIKETVKTAIAFGHPALALTDHGVVQSFPEAADAAKGKIKLIYGVEGYMPPAETAIVTGDLSYSMADEFIVFDLETTGLSANQCGITEIGAVKLKNGQVIDRYSTFVNPRMEIPANIVHLTGITEEMVANAPEEEEALAGLKRFAGNAVLCAHNADFDMGFLRSRGRLVGVTFENPVLDTLLLSRAVFPELRRHRLDTMCKKLNIRLDGHHRAVNDAEATATLMTKLLLMARERKELKTLRDINEAFEGVDISGSDHHIILLAKTQAGLKNLYKLISISHLDYFKSHPRMPKNVISQYRDGLIIGSACEAGELYTAVLNGDLQKARRMAEFYDYLEIQPDGNNQFLIRSGKVLDKEELHQINRKIIEIAQELGKPVVATGDVHFLKPEDECYRRILQAGQGYEDADIQPPLYFRTTEEMLAEFDYLGDELAYEVVVAAPRRIADMVEEVEPLPPYKLYAPNIDGAEDFIVQRSLETAKRIYGDPLPEIVQKRLDKELGSITTYGFAVLFYIAHKLVKKSLDDDYLVGSRGSVGSSFVATMTDITEVNPLPPHYICPNCKHSDFDVDSETYTCGPDLPDKICPVCGTQYRKAGFDIPFEVFLGFKGDKVPDIDLNFSGEYQPTMHKYTEVLFGAGNVFRAGTIGTIAERTAFGYVKNYLTERGMEARNAEIERLCLGCVGVKRTTGQHPGGIIVVPKEFVIEDFCPVQHPADDPDSDIITTHFDFNSLHDRLVKLDILGHDDPTMLRMLKDLTGIDPRSIPADDPDTMSLFCSTKALGVTAEDIMTEQGTYGVPEFGTSFVRGMLKETAPKTMGELIRISGLSHGTDVWLNNAQTLIKNGTATLRQTICTRDDIMNYLLTKGVEPKMAFSTMESVRKGKGLKPEMEEAMIAAEVPDWFIESCKKVKYLFPKAHAVAYVTMGFRVAWYKVHRPREYYATYYTVRADDFDASLMLQDIHQIKQEIQRLNQMPDQKQKDKNLQIILEIVLEMRARGIQFTSIDLYKSHSTKFLITEDGRIRPPLNSLPGVGTSAAKSIEQARADGPFLSEENLKQRSGISTAVMDVLREYHCLDGLSKTDQISLFDLF